MKLHDLECMLVHETERAVLVTVDGKHKAWLPRSAIEIDSSSGCTIVTAPEALLIEKELV